MRDLQGQPLHSLPRPQLHHVDGIKQRSNRSWRQVDPALFQQGSYLPLTVTGPAADHLCVFARQFEGRALVVIAPRLLYTLCQGDPERLGGARWTDTHMQGDPALPPGPWTDVLTGTQWADLGADLGTGLARAPLALLRSG